MACFDVKKRHLSQQTWPMQDESALVPGEMEQYPTAYKVHTGRLGPSHM